MSISYGSAETDRLIHRKQLCDTLLREAQMKL